MKNEPKVSTEKGSEPTHFIGIITQTRSNKNPAKKKTESQHNELFYHRNKREESLKLPHTA
jgi:hypothetical protein